MDVRRFIVEETKWCIQVQRFLEERDAMQPPETPNEDAFSITHRRAAQTNLAVVCIERVARDMAIGGSLILG